MKRFSMFVGIGSLFATIEEFLTVVVLKRDLASYIFTLLVLFPSFLSAVYVSSRLLDRLQDREAARELAHYFAYGFCGLMIEWFLIGLSPWSNPNANPLLMALFQAGMFSFWATVAFAPRLFLKIGELNLKTRRAILRFYVPYFMFVYVVALAAPRERQFAAIIPLILFGYLFLNVFYLSYFRQAFSRGERGRPA